MATTKDMEQLEIAKVNGMIEQKITASPAKMNPNLTSTVAPFEKDDGSSSSTSAAAPIPKENCSTNKENANGPKSQPTKNKTKDGTDVGIETATIEEKGNDEVEEEDSADENKTKEDKSIESQANKSGLQDGERGEKDGGGEGKVEGGRKENEREEGGEEKEGNNEGNKESWGDARGKMFELLTDLKGAMVFESSSGVVTKLPDVKSVSLIIIASPIVSTPSDLEEYCIFNPAFI